MNTLAYCGNCGKKDLLSSMKYDTVGCVFLCPECESATNKLRKSRGWKLRYGDNRKKHANEIRIERKSRFSKNLIVSTTPELSGWRIKEYLGIHGVEFTLTSKPLPDCPLVVSDYVANFSNKDYKLFFSEKEAALECFKFGAYERGANAVVGVRLDFKQIGDHLVLIINGTLVAIEPLIAPSATAMPDIQ